MFSQVKISKLVTAATSNATPSLSNIIELLEAIDPNFTLYHYHNKPCWMIEQSTDHDDGHGFSILAKLMETRCGVIPHYDNKHIVIPPMYSPPQVVTNITLIHLLKRVSSILISPTSRSNSVGVPSGSLAELIMYSSRCDSFAETEYTREFDQLIKSIDTEEDTHIRDTSQVHELVEIIHRNLNLMRDVKPIDSGLEAKLRSLSVDESLPLHSFSWDDEIMLNIDNNASDTVINEVSKGLFINLEKGYNKITLSSETHSSMKDTMILSILKPLMEDNNKE